MLENTKAEDRPAGGIRLQSEFKRKGSDLYVGLSISLMDALLGGEKEAETFRGKILLTVPPESQNGQVFRKW